MGDQSTFDFFRQETSHAEAVVRTEAMANLTLVCALMTPEKVRGDLVPYLQTKVTDLDQVLVALAKRLGDMVPYVGGPDHAHILISIAEPLCAIEETVVRNNAAASVAKILSQLEEKHTAAISAYLALAKRLSSEETGESFYSRVSVCLFIDELFRLVTNSTDKGTLNEVFSALCKDEMLIVKRHAAMAFGKATKHVDSTLQTGDFLQILKSFVHPDEHPTVRIIGMETVYPYCKILLANNALVSVTVDLTQMIKLGVEDHSWKIRLAIAKEYGGFASIFTPDIINGEIFAGIVQLLQDSEPEVRINACQNMLPYLKVCGPELFLVELVPIAVQLAEDSIVNVRKNLAEMCVNVAAEIGNESVAQHMFDLVAKFLADESPLVRIRVVAKLDLISQKIPNLCIRLTSAIVGVHKDAAWRVRKQWCSVMPKVVKHMGTQYFTDNFLDIFLEMFKDGVSDVRSAACCCMADFINCANVSFVYENIYPTVKSLQTGDYLLRLTMLEAFKNLLLADLSDRFKSEVLALVINTASDSVPNVRIATIKVLTTVAKRFGDDPSSKSLIKPVIAELEKDKDKDVKYYAVEALKACG